MNSPLSVTVLEPFLRAISSIAVITGTILVVLQLRVNAKQARARTAFDLIGKVIDPSFPVRRHLLYEVAEKHAGGNWTGFNDVANLDEGALWPTSFALKELTAADEARIAALVVKAVS